ncbi:MAG: exodeoxyribonuclease III [Gammaproteobacteria bacterium]|nr:exodeoxyribonuclease III [Gammaproteobacteria bacterium]NNM14012.1 exodeoxyribonuclease III [Gammaproteobacteria bacterium]
MQIATWNVNSLKVRLNHLLDWLETNPVDVIGLQETKSTDDKFPVAEIEAAGYHVAFAGQKTYNGVAVLSKHSITEVVTDFAGIEDPMRRVLGCTINGVRIYNLYFPNGQALDSDKFHYKMNWLEALHAQLESESSDYDKRIVMGDFNIAPSDEDVHAPEEWAGKIHCSALERTHIARLKEKGFVDCFRQFEQEPNLFSWWDYRAGSFRKNNGLRIDLIMASEELAKNCQKCWIDKAPRKLEKPSDHTPVVAEFKV